MMSTKNTRRKTIAYLAEMAALAAVSFMLTLPAQAADDATPVRAAVSKQISSGGRDGRADEAVRHEYAALVRNGQREPRVAAKTGAAAAGTQSTSNDFWIFDADVVLFNDDDNDGYFHGVDLLFDADTYFDAADVYAALFLSYEGGPWNEYAVTDDFTIFGASSDDEYVVVTELETGYPTGDYDLLIELYDAYDGTFLTSFGPAESSALSFLPLEDFQRDAPVIEEVVVVGHGGGGAVFALLPLALLMRLFRGAMRPGWRQPVA